MPNNTLQGIFAFLIALQSLLLFYQVNRTEPLGLRHTYLNMAANAMLLMAVDFLLPVIHWAPQIEGHRLHLTLWALALFSVAGILWLTEWFLKRRQGIKSPILASSIAAHLAAPVQIPVPSSSVVTPPSQTSPPVQQTVGRRP